MKTDQNGLFGFDSGDHLILPNQEVECSVAPHFTLVPTNLLVTKIVGESFVMRFFYVRPASPLINITSNLSLLLFTEENKAAAPRFQRVVVEPNQDVVMMVQNISAEPRRFFATLQYGKP